MESGNGRKVKKNGGGKGVMKLRPRVGEERSGGSNL